VDGVHFPAGAIHEGHFGGACSLAERIDLEGLLDAVRRRFGVAIISEGRWFAGSVWVRFSMHHREQSDIALSLLALRRKTVSTSIRS
jgi:hypothetical protein